MDFVMNIIKWNIILQWQAISKFKILFISLITKLNK